MLRPDPDLLNREERIAVLLDGRVVFDDVCGGQQEIVLSRHAERLERRVAACPDRLTHPWKNFTISVVDEPPSWEGGPETTLGNWLTEAMRDIAGTNIALCTKGHYRYESSFRVPRSERARRCISSS